MAVQQNKKSPSKRGMHRSHDHLDNAAARASSRRRGEVHLRHHISPSGYYRGKKVVKTKGRVSAASPRRARRRACRQRHGGASDGGDSMQ